MCEIFIVPSSFATLDGYEKSHLFTKEIRFFITNFQGNFQHHPIFIILIFPPFHRLQNKKEGKTVFHPRLASR